MEMNERRAFIAAEVFTSDYVTVAELSQKTGDSPRTISRDLDLLIPIFEFDCKRGHQGGYFATNLSQQSRYSLRPKEAALLYEIAEKADDPEDKKTLKEIIDRLYNYQLYADLN